MAAKNFLYSSPTNVPKRLHTDFTAAMIYKSPSQAIDGVLLITMAYMLVVELLLLCTNIGYKTPNQKAQTLNTYAKEYNWICP